MNQMIKYLPVLMIVLFSNCKGEAQSGETIAKDIPISIFLEKLESSDEVQLLDVRRPDEWDQGIIENAITINWFDEDFEEKIQSLDKDNPVLVYCASGGRSGKAMKLMKEKGFFEVYNLEGGIGAWKSAGLPIVKK